MNFHPHALVDNAPVAPGFTPGPADRIHGGPDALGAAPHDFSTNSNACGPCPQALEAVREADCAVYPDSGYTALRQDLARFHGVDAWRVVLAGSASEFIFRMTALTAQRGDGLVWCPPHSYGDYLQAARSHRLGVAERPDQAALVWTCEPSSPLGSADQVLSAWVASPAARSAASSHGGRLRATVVDCAYEPLRLSGQPSLSNDQHDQVWQLFTPNKALGMTGVRAAYALAPLDDAAVVRHLDQLCASWPVGAHGVAMLCAWVRDDVQQWLRESLTTLRGWKERQLAICESLGWACHPSDANFFTARPDSSATDTDLPAVLRSMRQHGIKLRDTTSFGLPGQVRLGVLPPASQDALQVAWQRLNRKTP